MKLLDRYVARIVAGAFGAGIVFFVFLSVVMELLSNLSRYIDRAGERGYSGADLAALLASYYLHRLPVIFTTVTPFVTVVACMFATARLLHANEVVPMLFTGRSTMRVLRPMLLCGALAGLAMAGCWQWVMPHVAVPLAAAESLLKEGEVEHRNIIDEADSPAVTRRFYAVKYVPRERTLHGVAMLSEGVLAADTTLVTAAAATWDGARRDWRLSGGRMRHGQDETPVEWLERSDLTPDLVVQRARDTIDPDTQSYTELVATIAARPHRPELRLALHRHITYPLANLVLLLLALPLAVWFERGSRAGRVLLAIALCGGYLVFDLVCQSLGQREILHPIVMAWSPTIVFGALGVVLFGSMRT